MAVLTRRRFLSISAAGAAVSAAGGAPAAPVRRWEGRALGARAAIRLAHPDGARIAARAFAEIERLESVFSLYRAGSALARLNRDGRLDAPPVELVECLGLCGAVHRATEGRFDPTVQPLWTLHAEAHAAGRAPEGAVVAAALDRVGWAGVGVSAAAITLRPGMALTLNGVAQGYIADRVAALLRAEGLSEVLVDTGEHHAIGGDWPVTLVSGAGTEGRLALRDRALASSAPQGTVFDAAGVAGHILDPRAGMPAAPRWRLVSVTAPRAALADALSTALVLMTREEIARTLAAVPEARLAAAV
ncbi:FAD:protein FMN transferase [Rhodosalinus sediminis]|uniref:FAD:protein FMN transferase n=1 Tax=Rhodosalinus sediminis TaxID=1940533 RepID=A0A3D9BK93_9RHOB|nr:FAD:protein FMN transferase [Rhodosalinus sediminis]REC53928.1 FAD:protein FMN transferase [Rhodosalinus sediminis]